MVVLFVGHAVVGCRANESWFAEAYVVQSIELAITKDQSYLATMVVPARARPDGHPRSHGSFFEMKGARIEILSADALNPIGPAAETCVGDDQNRVRDVRRETLADGQIVSCRQAEEIAVFRTIRVDDAKVYCEILSDAASSDADLTIATNMCRSLTLAWHADNEPHRFRFPCTGQLTFGRNAAGEGTWLTHLNCPPESQGIE
ncbi:MAG TPA: hypothetical protein VGM90_36165 [Kofleriaceae bacterium]